MTFGLQKAVESASLLGRALAGFCIKLACWHFADYCDRLYRRYPVLRLRSSPSVSAGRYYYLGTRGSFLSGDGVMATLHAFPSLSVVQLTCPQPQQHLSIITTTLDRHEPCDGPSTRPLVAWSAAAVRMSGQTLSYHQLHEMRYHGRHYL